MIITQLGNKHTHTHTSSLKYLTSLHPSISYATVTRDSYEFIVSKSPHISTDMKPGSV